MTQSFLNDDKSNLVNSDTPHVRFIKLLENLSQERAWKYPTTPMLVQACWPMITATLLLSLLLTYRKWYLYSQNEIHR